MSETTASVSAAPTKKMPSILGGAMIIAGTAVGAGMFALPVYSAGMWFSVSMALLLFCCFCAYTTSLYMIEAGQHYPEGASFTTIAADTLGPLGKLFATGCVAFVSFILCYAYISGGSSIVAQVAADMGMNLSHSSAAVLFAVVFATLVIAGSRVVDKVSVIMLGGMVLTFFGSTSMLTVSADADKLFPALPFSDSLSYLWVAIPLLVTSFGVHSTVPSLAKHYNKDMQRVRLAVLLGMLLTLLVYVVWQLAIMGNVGREQFSAIIAEGGNVATLISAVGQSTDVTGVESALMVFGNLALASSFIGVALGLQDLVKDFFKLGDSLKHSLVAGVITFLPPAIGGALAPNGFITAIGYAALAAVVFVLILPPMMARVLRQRGQQGQFQVAGGMARLNLVFGFGVLALVAETLHLLGLLPQFG
ncbi:amino acid permease [Ferrimonas senticii]|uniref:amino acid permease n=1 Tax=Ferrimonas senticii TaxID=394566 RepID=UPI000556CAD1|nr:aromatic amino acid transport family protein [Ferrimonas senticii]